MAFSRPKRALIFFCFPLNLIGFPFFYSVSLVSSSYTLSLFQFFFIIIASAATYLLLHNSLMTSLMISLGINPGSGMIWSTSTSILWLLCICQIIFQNGSAHLKSCYFISSSPILGCIVKSGIGIWKVVSCYCPH